MHSPSRSEVARHWISERAGILGLAIAAVSAACLASLVVPIGPGERVVARITRFGLEETDTGSYPVAVAEIPTGSIQIRLPRANSCVLGSELHLIKRRYLLWRAYSAAFPPC